MEGISLLTQLGTPLPAAEEAASKTNGAGVEAEGSGKKAEVTGLWHFPEVLAAAVEPAGVLLAASEAGKPVAPEQPATPTFLGEEAPKPAPGFLLAASLPTVKPPQGELPDTAPSQTKLQGGPVSLRLPVLRPVVDPAGTETPRAAEGTAQPASPQVADGNPEALPETYRPITGAQVTIEPMGAAAAQQQVASNPSQIDLPPVQAESPVAPSEAGVDVAQPPAPPPDVRFPAPTAAPAGQGAAQAHGDPPPSLASRLAATPLEQPAPTAGTGSSGTGGMTPIQTSESGPATGGQAASVRMQVLEQLPVREAISETPQRMTLQLDPPHLGRVEVTVQRTGDQLTVILNAARPEAEAALREGIQDLINGITARSGPWTEVQVRLAGEGEDRGRGQPEQKQNQDSEGGERKDPSSRERQEKRRQNPNR